MPTVLPESMVAAVAAVVADTPVPEVGLLAAGGLAAATAVLVACLAEVEVVACLAEVEVEVAPTQAQAQAVLVAVVA